VLRPGTRTQPVLAVVPVKVASWEIGRILRRDFYITHKKFHFNVAKKPHRLKKFDEILTELRSEIEIFKGATMHFADPTFEIMQWQEFELTIQNPRFAKLYTALIELDRAVMHLSPAIMGGQLTIEQKSDFLSGPLNVYTSLKHFCFDTESPTVDTIISNERIL
jgi:hypothetical protein